MPAKNGTSADLSELGSTMAWWLAALDDQRDPLEKARLLADKLRDHPAALILLDQTWQAGIRPEGALTALFGIHRQAAATAEAVSLLRRAMGALLRPGPGLTMTSLACMAALWVGVSMAFPALRGKPGLMLGAPALAALQRS